MPTNAVRCVALAGIQPNRLCTVTHVERYQTNFTILTKYSNLRFARFAADRFLLRVFVFSLSINILGLPSSNSPYMGQLYCYYPAKDFPRIFGRVAIQYQITVRLKRKHAEVLPFLMPPIRLWLVAIRANKMCVTA